VIAYASFNTDAGQMCLAKDNKVPLMSWDQLPAHDYQDAGGYLWLTRLNESRMLLNWVRTMSDRGYVTSKNRIGVLYEGTPYDSQAVEGDMLPEMEKLGIKPVQVIKTSPNLQDSINQMPSAVLSMQTANVDYIFFVASVFTKEQFFQHAQDQQYFPHYTDSDIKDGCAELLHEFVSPYPSQEYDKTLCVTAHFTGATPANQDSEFGELIGSPFAKYADSVYLKWNPQGYDNPPPSAAEQSLGFGTETVKFMNYIVGGQVVLWANAARRVGRNLTRAAWVDQMGQTGVTDQTAFAPHFNYAVGHWDGPDQIAVLQFHAEASEGYNQRKFHLLVPFFPAYY
jgi:hypothetical protein